MSNESLKSIYINMYLLAAADGWTHPAETEYLQRFAKAAGIDEEQARAWSTEAAAGELGFQEIADPELAREHLGVMARMVRVDGVFDDREQSAYIAMGKTLGFTHDELGQALRDFWDDDPLARLSRPVEIPPGAAELGPVVIVEDDMCGRELVEASSPGLDLVYTPFAELLGSGSQSKLILFHAAEERQDSFQRLAKLKQTFPAAQVAFVARRDQAPQIGLLLEQGADRCFVEPLYPGELTKGLIQLAGKAA
jgi:uncharacterized tellurite resistance protein B-like protein